jgi:glucose/arabinose dehydrogenase
VRKNAPPFWLLFCTGWIFGLGFLFAKPKSVVAVPSLTWPTITLSQLTSGLNSPVYITHAGDNSGRLFVVEQAGRIRVLISGTLQGTPFLDITGKVRSPASGGGNEQGLLSAAFPPEFSSKKYFYVYYTNHAGNNQVSRFYLSSNPNQADPNSEELILLLNHPQFENHNGGQLAFGPDGYLYIGTGDGGSSGDPYGNAQNLGSPLGKILRIDVEMARTSTPAGPNLTFLPILLTDVGNSTRRPYAIPSDNPFVGAAGVREEIWAFGLRNPWRFSFDRQTHDVYIGDVGQNRIEEVDFQPASSHGGENYGWNILEGTLCYKPSSGCTPPLNYVPPVSEYNHGTNDSNGCSISGGYVYRGAQFPGLNGIYFYGDFCSGIIWGLQQSGGVWQDQLLLYTAYNITSFGEDQSGDLFVADRSGGIYQVVETKSK